LTLAARDDGFADRARVSGRAAGFVALAAAGSIWGTPFVLGKWALEELSVAHMTLLRFVLGSAVLMVAYAHERRTNRTPLARSEVVIAAVAGIVGVPIQYLVQYEGLARTTVSHASLMVGVLPVMLALAAALFAHEHLDAIGWSWLVASTIGAALVAVGGGASDGGDRSSLFGDALVVLSLVAGVVWVLLSQRLMRRHSPVATAALVYMIGTAALIVWVVATAGVPVLSHLSERTWVSVVTMGVAGTAAATLLWNWGLARVPASQAGVFVNLEPVIGAILGVLVFHDRFGVLSVAGAGLILAASVAVSMRQSSRAPN
jgi:drug/metabolite transporter (DMT)-like permease